MVAVGKHVSPIGEITFAGKEEGLTGLWFDGQKYFGAGLPEQYEKKEIPVFADARRWLDLYFQGKDPGFIPKLCMETSAFRKEVWEILLKIPYGKTMTYKEIAQILARQRGLSSMSAQAVGGAVGHNPISLMIPCHRVVGTNGSLTGYAGGIEKKKALLELEKV